MRLNPLVIHRGRRPFFFVMLISMCCVLLGMLTISADANQNAVAPKSIEPFDDCNGAAWCPHMVVIPGGTFLMGSPGDEAGRFDDEGPQRKVSIRSFAVGQFDVTRGQWAAFVAATNHTAAKGCFFAFSRTPSWRDSGYPQKDDHPVVCVTWGDGQEYARWLSTRTVKHYRLLTEAEWEYAARAGSVTAYPWGSKPGHEYANYGADEPYTPLASGRDKWKYGPDRHAR